MSNRTYTIEEIKENLLKSDAWVKRALVRLYSFQTSDEKSSEQASHRNGAGFNKVDAEILSSFAQQVERRDYLSAKQLEIARKKLPKYAKQLKAYADAQAAEAAEKVA